MKYQDRAFMFVAGKRIYEADTHLDSVNPATEEIHARVPCANAEIVDEAINAAMLAQKQWWAMSWQERAGAIRAVADTLLTRAPDIAALECADTGNTIRTLERDIKIAADNLHFFAGVSTQNTGHAFQATPGNIHLSIREPYGVVARIVPFNHPFMFAAARIAAPLAAGNAVIIKTPEQSPLSASYLAEACEAHLPKGLVSIVHGDGLSVGDVIVRHKHIHRIGFTGAVPTGLAIQRSAAEVAVKHVSLELGGKNPLIAFPDVDADTIASAAVRGMNFAWSGQSCGSTSRLLAHEDIYDEVVALVTERTKAIKLGDPSDPASDMGPMNSSTQRDKALDYIAIAKAEGARLVSGGEAPSDAEYQKGYWVQPTVFADVDPNMRIAREEVFGPILSIMKWRSLDVAIDIANATEFGLTTGIWTNNHTMAMETAQRVEAGYVWINGGSSHFVGMPFGGAKNSGLGAEESLEELHSYSRQKAIHMVGGLP